MSIISFGEGDNEDDDDDEDADNVSWKSPVADFDLDELVVAATDWAAAIIILELCAARICSANDCGEKNGKEL